MIRRVLAAACVGALGACAPAATQTPEPVISQPAPPPPNANAVPAGTDLSLRLNSELAAENVSVGQTFTASVENALVATNGDVVIPAGATVTGMVTGVNPAAGTGSPAAVRLNFLRIGIDGTTHPFTADILSTQVPATTDTGLSDTARAAAVGAAAGAVLGAVIGGDLRDALIGAAIGAGAGTIISLGTGDAEQVLPEGTRLNVRTRDTISLRDR
jgi:hypothetical protein